MPPAVVDESKEGAIIGGVLGGALLVVLSVGCYLFGKHRRIKAITKIEIPDGSKASFYCLKSRTLVSDGLLYVTVMEKVI